MEKRDRLAIEEELSKAEERLQLYENECAKVRLEIQGLQKELLSYAAEQHDPAITIPYVNNSFSPHDKVKLFRSLFRGREDVYPKRWESLKKGRCRHEKWTKNHPYVVLFPAAGYSNTAY